MPQSWASSLRWRWNSARCFQDPARQAAGCQGDRAKRGKSSMYRAYPRIMSRMCLHSLECGPLLSASFYDEHKRIQHINQNSASIFISRLLPLFSSVKFSFPRKETLQDGSTWTPLENLPFLPVVWRGHVNPLSFWTWSVKSQTMGSLRIRPLGVRSKPPLHRQKLDVGDSFPNAMTQCPRQVPVSVSLSFC